MLKKLYGTMGWFVGVGFGIRSWGDVTIYRAAALSDWGPRTILPLACLPKPNRLLPMDARLNTKCDYLETQLCYSIVMNQSVAHDYHDQPRFLSTK